MATPSSPPLRILVAVDAGEAAGRAAATAHALFGDHAEYLLVHATDWDETTPAGDGATDAATRFAHLPNVESLTVAGEPGHAVVEAAHDAGVDVIVVGAQERGWFRRLFDPSVSRHVVGAADRPVLVVRDTAAVPTGPARLVIVATDGSEGSIEAARTAHRFFGHGPWYEVVQVAPAPVDPNVDATGFAAPLIDDAQAEAIYQEAVTQAESEVAATAQEIDAPHVSETVLVGDPAVRLCEWSREAAADVLVIAGTSTSGLLHVLLGSVSEHVVAHAEVPVLVVPAPR